MPASRVTSTTPPSLMTRMISSEYRIASHSTTCMARIAAHTDTCAADAVGLLHGQDDRDDRAGTGQQRHAQRYERDVDVLGLLRLVRLAGQQVERDEQQQQSARDHQRGHGDMQVVEDLLAEQPEDGDHAEGHADGLERHPRCTLAGRPAVSARKIGVIPGGSMITKRVRKREPKTATSNTVRPCER